MLRLQSYVVLALQMPTGIPENLYQMGNKTNKKDISKHKNI